MVDEFLGYIIENGQVHEIFDFKNIEKKASNFKLLESIYQKASPGLIPGLVDQLLAMALD